MNATAARMVDTHAKRLASKGYTPEEIDAILDVEGMDEDLNDIMED